MGCACGCDGGVRVDERDGVGWVGHDDDDDGRSENKAAAAANDDNGDGEDEDEGGNMETERRGGMEKRRLWRRWLATQRDAMGRNRTGRKETRTTWMIESVKAQDSVRWWLREECAVLIKCRASSCVGQQWHVSYMHNGAHTYVGEGYL